MSGLPPAIFSLITLIVILYLTLFPHPLGEEMPPLFPGADKLVHAVMFGFLTLMLLLDKQRKNNWKTVTWATDFKAMMISACIGIAIEFAQFWMALGRSFELFDMIADCIGVGVSGLAWIIFQPLWSFKN